MTEQPLSFEEMFPSFNTMNAIGTIKSSPEDFKVTEISHETNFTGEGEHLWLWIEKTDSNTDWVAKQLAHICQVPARQVGYAGLKDRHAVTRQWFSIQLPQITDTVAIKQALPDEIRILESQQHNRKIKTGYLKGNNFELLVRDIQGSKDSIEHNIQNVLKHGVPNYFGPQRFGNNMTNIAKAKDLFSGQFKTRNKNLKSLLISTARSHIFNNILSARIKNNIWQQVMDGDVMQLNNSRSWFHAIEASDAEINQRLNEKDIHISAALWGEDAVQSTGDCAKFEQSIADQSSEYFSGFQQHRVKQDRRAIRLCPNQLQYQWTDQGLKLSFELPAGAYATVVLAEILNVKEGNKHKH